MNRLILFTFTLSTIFLTSCAENPHHLVYSASTPEQMKSSKLVGRLAGHCYKGEICKFEPKEFLMVTNQDEDSITFENRDPIRYTDLQ